MRVIIAGTNKAGTTSLFRYLADHPQVCASKVKEANFFDSDFSGTREQQLAAYDACFPDCGAKKTSRVEATPSYLGEGRQTAARIHALVPDARLIFILREPVERLMSFFHQNSQSKFNKGLGEFTLDEYVSLTEKVVKQNPDEIGSGPPGNAYLQFQRGCYAKKLSEYLEFFPSQNILLLFFDELSSDTVACVSRVASFLEIDPGFYANYLFRTENKTRKYRNPRLHALGSRVNKMLESTMNRHPGMRNALRKMYLSLNEKRGDNRAVDPRHLQRLRLLYAPENALLMQFLEQQYPELVLPCWLSAAA